MKHKLLFFFTLITTFLQAQAFNQYDRLWSTYVGGNSVNGGEMIKDQQGNFIITGGIGVINPNRYTNYFQSFVYPSTSPFPYIESNTNHSYIAKFSPAGILIKSGYLPYTIHNIHLDNQGNMIILGTTNRTDLGTIGTWFPQLSSSWRHRGSFITKIDDEFNTIWTSYVPFIIPIDSVTTDQYGNIYGVTNTAEREGLSTPDTFSPHFTRVLNGHSNPFNAFIYKLNPNGQLIWGTYYGLSEAISIKLINHELYILLNYSSDFEEDFAYTTSNAIQQTPASNILAKLNAENGQRIYSTFFGEEEKLYLDYLAVNNNAIYVSGYTEALSSSTNLITPNSYQPNYSGNTDNYLAKLDLNFNPIWGTYIGGDSYDSWSQRIAFQGDQIYFLGSTTSNHFIQSPNSFRLTNAGLLDAFVMKFTPAGQLTWGSFFGANLNEYGTTVIPVDDETFYLSGNTRSFKDITTPNSHQPNYSYLPDNGDYGQLFLAKFGRNDDLNTSDISTSTLKLYPNPAKDKVYIKGFIHQDSWIEVYNLVGQKVVTQKAKSGLTQEIDVQFLPKGTYIIKATDINGKVFQEKLIIQ